MMTGACVSPRERDEGAASAEVILCSHNHRKKVIFNNPAYEITNTRLKFEIFQCVRSKILNHNVVPPSCPCG